jgi:effector-binding domain-containing protein
LSRFVPAACGEVWEFIRAKNILGAGRHVALYLDGGVVEVGAEVSERFAGDARVICSHLPAGAAVTTTHFGPYGGLAQVHAELREWSARQGHELSKICWEIYGHWDESWNADPSKIRTDVFQLLQNQMG